MGDFFPGAKVICVRGFKLAPPLVVVPELGREYIVRAICREQVSTHIIGVKMWGLRLHWLINPPVPTVEGVLEQYFCIYGLDGLPNFKPVVERKTDIGLLEKLLIRKDVKNLERV